MMRSLCFIGSMFVTRNALDLASGRSSCVKGGGSWRGRKPSVMECVKECIENHPKPRRSSWFR